VRSNSVCAWIVTAVQEPPSIARFAPASSVSAPDLFEISPAIPDHELLHPIGRGSYGEVWLARNIMGTLRAVKIVYRRQFDDDKPYEREFRGIQKFEPISRSHEGFIDLLQIGRNDAQRYFYYIMELADPIVAADVRKLTSPPKPQIDYHPHTLRAELERGALPIDQCLALGLLLASALEHLHKNGLVHRDIKPSNIIFVNGAPKLADIGLVADIDEAKSFVGTLGYIPPEGPGTAQADLYSLGIVLYVASTGKSHRDFPEPPADLAARTDRERWLEFQAIIHRACHVEPRQRYANATAMLRDLEICSAGKSVRQRHNAEARRKLAARMAAIIVAGSLLTGAAFLILRTPKGNPVPLSKNPEAEALYQQAVYEFQSLTPERVRQAYTNLTQAVKLDPGFVAAHYMFFELYWDRWGENLPPLFDRDANMGAIAQTLKRIAPNSAQYHATDCWLKFNRWEYQAAIDEARLATQIDPAFMRAHYLYGWFMLLIRGDAETARKEIDTAIKLQGSDIIARTGSGSPFYFERKFDLAIERWRQVAQIEPRSAEAHSSLGQAYEAKGDYAKAINEYEIYDKLYSKDPALVGANYREQRAALEDGGGMGWFRTKLEQLEQNPAADIYDIARLYARLDQRTDAFRLLNRAYAEHDGALTFLIFDDCWDALRGDPRFKQIVKRMGLGLK
jgi:tetratricopeptide (TPR) repeat protein